MTAPTPAVVRAWARANGHVVSDKGRIPAAVQAAYDVAHAAPAPVPPVAAAPPPAQAPVQAPVSAPAWGAGQVPPSVWSQPEPRAWNAPGTPPPPPSYSTGRDGFSVAALVLGILPAMGGVLGIVFGIVGLRRTSRSGRPGRGMAIGGIVLGSLWLVGIIVAVVVSEAAGPDRDAAGAVVSDGDVSAFDLRLGDCAAELSVGDARTLRLVPCTQPHEGEVYAVFSLPGDDYPGETDTDRLAKGGCDRRLTDQFGASASYDYHYLLPTAESWATGDREVTCVARNPDGRQLTGPLRPS